MRLPCSILALALLATGCCTIVSQSEYPVTFESTPQGAEVKVQDHLGATVYKGITPATVKLRSSDGYFDNAEYTVTFSKEGLPGAKRELKAGLNGWYWGNIVFGGLLGMLVVDPASGAMWKLDKNCSVDLGSPGPRP